MYFFNCTFVAFLFWGGQKLSTKDGLSHKKDKDTH